MIINNRELMLDALAALWNKKKNAPRQLHGSVFARAAYLYICRGCTYKEIAHELNVGSRQAARTYVWKGVTWMKKYIIRKYGVNAFDA
jgi:hypothetical protein